MPEVPNPALLTTRSSGGAVADARLHVVEAAAVSSGRRRAPPRAAIVRPAPPAGRVDGRPRPSGSPPWRAARTIAAPIPLDAPVTSADVNGRAGTVRRQWLAAGVPTRPPVAFSRACARARAVTPRRRARARAPPRPAPWPQRTIAVDLGGRARRRRRGCSPCCRDLDEAAVHGDVEHRAVRRA